MTASTKTAASSVSVAVEWDGYSWVGVVDGGGATQAKNLDKLRKNVVEVVQLMQSRAIDEGDVDLRITVPGVVDGWQAEALTTLRTMSSDVAAVLGAVQAQMIESLKDAGFPLRDIGGVVGLSHQRVDQILAHEPTADPSLPTLPEVIRADDVHQLVDHVLRRPRRKGPKRSATS